MRALWEDDRELVAGHVEIDTKNVMKLGRFAIDVLKQISIVVATTLG